MTQEESKKRVKRIIRSGSKSDIANAIALHFKTFVSTRVPSIEDTLDQLIEPLTSESFISRL